MLQIDNILYNCITAAGRLKKKSLDFIMSQGLICIKNNK